MLSTELMEIKTRTTCVLISDKLEFVFKVGEEEEGAGAGGSG